MQSIKRNIISLVLGMLSWSMATALPVEQLSSVNWLTNNKINEIHRGSDGFMWFASIAGLCRYDGYSHKLYYINETDSIPEGENDVDHITEDYEGYLWLRSHHAYVVYNPHTDRIEHIADSLLASRGIKGTPRVVKADKETGLWVYTEQPSAVWHVERVRGRARSISPIGNPGLVQGVVTDFVDTPYGVVAVTRRGDLYIINPSLDSVSESLMDVTGGQVSEYGKVFSLMYDRDGLLWIYNTDGMWLRDMRNKTWATSRLPRGGRGMVVKAVTQDRQGHIWIGRDHHGLEQAVKHDDRITFDEAYDPAMFPLSSSVTTVCDDGVGTLWIGTQKRGVFYHNETLHKFTLAQGDDVNCLEPRRDGKVWMGTDGSGVGIFDPATGRMTTVADPSEEPGTSAAVTAMIEDNEGTLYVGSFISGLRRLNGNRFEKIITDTQLDSAYTWSLAKTPDGDLWAATLEAGVYRYNRRDGVVKSYRTSNSAIPSDCVQALATDKDGNLYMGTVFGVGILRNGSDTIERLDELSPGTVNDLEFDSRGLLWIASHRGLSVYDPSRDKMHEISFHQPHGARFVIGIKEDAEGSIWVAEGGRLINFHVKYDPATGLLETKPHVYDHRDGLQLSDFNQRSFALLPTGEMLVGGLYGINRFKPSEIKLNDITPQVMFSSLKVDGREIKPGEKIGGVTVFDGALNKVRHITLSPSIDEFTVSLATDNYVHPDKTVYLYMLEGFNNKWIATSPGDNKVNYTNLSPGTYRLKVKAVNNDGFESDHEAVLTITVLVPFWLSPWAKALYLVLMLAAMGGVYILMRRRERRRFDESRRLDALAKEEELNRLKFRFMTNVSHDLRTPLTLLISPLDAMIKEGGDERTMRRLSLMRRNATQLLGLVNQLLDFRKSEVAGLSYSPADGEMVSFLENVCSQFGGLVSGKKIDFMYVPEIESLPMRFDQDKLSKVIMNLVGNAYKFTETGGSVKVTLRLKDDETALITVADTGVGISDTDKKRIFERFFQSESSRDPSATGYGIGLSLVSEYVALHKGSIEVRDNTPCGTIFEVSIPVVSCKHADAAAALAATSVPVTLPSASENAEKPSSASKPTALVVDDNPDMLELLKDGLRDSFHVVTANGGQEALKVMSTVKPSIIVTDLMMPGIDGKELSKSVKKDKELHHVPIIILTAKGDEEAKVEMLTLGVDDYITKPFNVELLALRMKRLVSLTALGQRSTLIDPEPESINITPLDEKLVEKAVKYVVGSIKRPELSVEELSAHMGMSRVHLYKKLKATTGKTPIEFIRLIRLKRAAQLLRESQLNVSEVAYQVGFNNPRNFSRYFRDEFGVLPSVYQEAKEQITIQTI